MAVLGALSLIALLIALILAITGAWIGAIIALGVLVGLVALLSPAVRHDPESHAARTTRRGLTNVISAARFVAVATRTWTRAGIALLRIKQRRQRVKGELLGQLAPLGEAVYRGQETRIEVLKAKADELERQLQEIDIRESAIISGARHAVEREKDTARTTRALPTMQATIPTEDERQQPPG